MVMGQVMCRRGQLLNTGVLLGRKKKGTDGCWAESHPHPPQGLVVEVDVTKDKPRIPYGVFYICVLTGTSQ